MACGTVLLLQLIATISMVFSASESVWERKSKYFFDGTNQFSFSKEKNIFVIVLDTLGCGHLKQCFKDFPEYKEPFKDFTWYVDARNNYKWTFPSLIHELTGAFVPPSKNEKDLYEKMWASPSAQSFYSQIKNAGYTPYMFIDKNYAGSPEFFYRLFPNVSERAMTYNVDAKKLCYCLAQMSGYSSSPYFLKKDFFYANDFADDIVQAHIESDTPKNDFNTKVAIKNDTFYNKIIQTGITTSEESPVYSLHYTYGAHSPWQLDEKCVRHDTPFDNPYPTVKSCCYLISEFIRLLKEKNIYDQTAIIVLSDHGPNDPKYSTPFDMTFMVKPFNAKNKEIIEDDSKVSSIDILPTILQIACEENADFSSFDGFPASRIPNDRKRVVFPAFKHPKLPPFLSVDGSSEMGHNCLAEYAFPEEASYQAFKTDKYFIRYIPLNEDAQIDEKILTDRDSGL